MEEEIINYCKPICIGFLVLDIFKSLMYYYHYNTMKQHFRNNLRLMHIDTDSLKYHITSKSFYDLLNEPNLLECMDTSNLPHDYHCYTPLLKKIPDYFQSRRMEEQY